TDLANADLANADLVNAELDMGRLLGVRRSGDRPDLPRSLDAPWPARCAGQHKLVDCKGKPAGGRNAQPHCTLMPASLMMGAQRPISAFSLAASAAGFCSSLGQTS